MGYTVENHDGTSCSAQVTSITATRRGFCAFNSPSSPAFMIGCGKDYSTTTRFYSSDCKGKVIDYSKSQRHTASGSTPDCYLVISHTGLNGTETLRAQTHTCSSSTFYISTLFIILISFIFL